MRIVAQGLDHPECVAIGPDGRLYAGGEAGQIYRIETASGKVEQIGSTGGFILGIALDARGNVYACDTELRGVVIVTPNGSVETVTLGTNERPMVTPNYPVFDDHGRLYVSDSGTWPHGGGCIYRVDPESGTAVWSDTTPQFTNGLALSADGRYLYVAESTLPGVTRIEILDDGAPGKTELVTLMPGTVPDGLAFDLDGRLYIACYRPDRIYTLEPDGRLLIFADDFQGTELAAPTNVAFGGPDMDHLFVGSLARWHIGALAARAPGLRLHYPETVLPLTKDST